MGDTHSDKVYSWYKNLNERLYQQAYIFQIPPKERDRNPNLTQNTPCIIARMPIKNVDSN